MILYQIYKFRIGYVGSFCFCPCFLIGLCIVLGLLGLGFVVLGLGVRRMWRLLLLVDWTWILWGDWKIGMLLCIKLAELAHNTKINHQIQLKWDWKHKKPSKHKQNSVLNQESISYSTQKQKIKLINYFFLLLVKLNSKQIILMLRLSIWYLYWQLMKLRSFWMIRWGKMGNLWRIKVIFMLVCNRMRAVYMTIDYLLVLF